MNTARTGGEIFRRGRDAVALFWVLGLVVACGGGSAPAEPTAAEIEAVDASPLETAQAKKAATGLIQQPANTEGRLLASNCFQCHGTLGLGGFEKIRGSEAREVLEFMTKPAGKDIMAAHAQGYTPAQLQKIIAYLQQ